MRTLVIDAAALARNLDRLRRAASARIIGVVKGNGYGLGLTDYARFLTEHGVDMLAVSTAEEAAALRQAGIAAEVLCCPPPQYHGMWPSCWTAAPS